MFGPDRKIWELDKGSATAGDVLGRSYMQRFYEGAVLHDRRKGPSGARGQDSAWVNGREVSGVQFFLSMIVRSKAYVVYGKHVATIGYCCLGGLVLAVWCGVVCSPIAPIGPVATADG